MIKDVVGSKNYNVWLEMLKRLVPYGRTHRLSVVVASMLQVTYEIAQEKEELNAKARKLSSIFESANEQDEENGLEPLLKITEQVFKDAGVGFKRVNRKGRGYSIAEEAVYQFLNWDAMPWEV
jgi:ribosomal protein L22